MPEAIKLRGTDLLKVISIIMVILGAIAIVSGLSALLSGSTMASMFGINEQGIQYFRVTGMISIVTGAVELAFGILGIKFCKLAERAGLLLMIGIIQLVITVFSTLYNYALAPMATIVSEQIFKATEEMYGVAVESVVPDAAILSGNLVFSIVRYVIPALFIVGALLNRLPPKAIMPVFTTATSQGASQYGPQMLSASTMPYAQQSQNAMPYTQDAVINFDMAEAVEAGTVGIAGSTLEAAGSVPEAEKKD
jgi:hypothetical protein